MPYLLIRHRVRDYDAWKPVFDAHGATRRDAGCRGGTLFRTAEDPANLVILFEWDSLENARRFAGSEDLRAAMQRAGVTDQPDLYFLEELDRPPV